MIRILTASKDTYITNKIIDNSFRATDANLGQAGSLDLFKLYNENVISSESYPIELSRLLIKFPIEEITSMNNDGLIDISDSSFKCKVKLHDIYGGQTTPSNFKLILFPLSQSFDEGMGMNVVTYSDLDSTNYITASYQNGTVFAWNRQGAQASGSLGQENIDIITSGTLDNSVGAISLSSEQLFTEGTEDLDMDVTTIVSGTVAGLIPNHGFLISYSGSYESDNRSYFVKRFASRNVSVSALRPKMILNFDDSILDNHSNMIFNVTSSLYLNNYHQGISSNILSGASATPLTGENCLAVKIESGSFKKIFSASQALRGKNRITGLYSASFAISSFDSTLYDQANLTGSITFNEVWTNLSETVTYLSSSLVIKKEARTVTNSINQNNILVSVLNLNSEYSPGEIIKLRVFAENRDREITYVKKPYEKKSDIFNNMHFRVRDALDGNLILDFDTQNNSTRLSTDADGMYFSFYTDSLPRGRVYRFEFLIRRNGIDKIVKDAASKFKIV